MELFRNIRLRIGNSLLRKKIERSKRKVSYPGISMVRKIGIVWDASLPQEFASLSRFFQKMHERNIDVTILGYFPGRNLPDQYTAIRYLSCIRREEIGFFYQPLSSEANSFISNNFDILIDINFRNLLPLKYITSLSGSPFKVGLYDAEKTDAPFDLMMELKTPVEIGTYLDETLHYLELINDGQVKQSKN